jgi:hypothetical protein
MRGNIVTVDPHVDVNLVVVCWHTIRSVIGVVSVSPIGCHECVVSAGSLSGRDFAAVEPDRGIFSSAPVFCVGVGSVFCREVAIELAFARSA